MDLKSSIHPGALDLVLGSATNATQKGQSQYSTPIELAAELARHLPSNRPVIVDLTCGLGQLLAGCAAKGTERVQGTTQLFGIDVDPRASGAGPFLKKGGGPSASFIQADLTTVYELMRQIQFEADCFVLNPPWSLNWHAERLAGLCDSKVPAVAKLAKSGSAASQSGSIDSTIATLMIALDRLSDRGEGLLIGYTSTLERLLFAPGAPAGLLAQHVWRRVAVPILVPSIVDGPFKDATVIFFSRCHNDGPVVNREDGTAVRPAYLARVNQFNVIANETIEKWQALRERVRALQPDAPPAYHLSLRGNNEIMVRLGLFDTALTKVNKALGALAKRLHELDGRNPMQVVTQRNERNFIMGLVAGQSAGTACWTVSPELKAAVEKAYRQYNGARAPLVPLPKIQRLGYLDEQDAILCVKDLSAIGDRTSAIFRAGQTYPITTRSMRFTKTLTKPNLHGEDEELELSGQELAINIDGKNFMDVKLRKPNIKVESGGPEGSVDGSSVVHFTLQDLVEHFEIPEVPDVAAADPDRFQGYINQLHELERITAALKFKSFQLTDYSAAAMVPGLVGAHDTGLGKSLKSITWPLLKCGFETVGKQIKVKGSVLIIAPGDLHAQLCKEYKKFYGITPTAIEDQAALLHLLRPSPGAAFCIPPGFYMTSYTRLTTNGVKKISAIAKLPISAAVPELNLTLQDLQDFWNNRGIHYKDEYATLGCGPDATLKALQKAHASRSRRAQAGRGGNGTISDGICLELDRCLNILENFVPPFVPELPSDPRPLSSQVKFVWKELIRHKLDEYSQGIGETGGESEVGPAPLVKCVFSPTMADLCSHLFDCVVIDEGVKMKGGDTQVGKGIRQMCPKYRLVLTATPVKNRLPDIFHLAWWAAGGHAEATARWPYAGGSEEQEKFAKTFMLEEFNKTKAKASGSNARSRFAKLRPEICNLHLLWKVLGPNVLRRRKSDIGESIVKKIRHVYRVPMGLFQRATYQYHLDAIYLDCNRKPAPGAKLQALRVAAAAPDSHLLDPRPLPPRSNGDCCKKMDPDDDGICRGCGSVRLRHRSQHSFTPKVACALTLIRDILQRGEQCAVFSAFNDPSDILSRYLTEAGVDHYIMDGRTNQARRGLRSAAFNNGDFPVTLAGIDSMAEGHNWDNVNNIISTSYSWSADKIIQADNRVHRLTSKKDVNIYRIICEQSADRVLEDNINEKTNSAELAIDGMLLGDTVEEKSMGELLRDAMRDFQHGIRAAGQDSPNEEILVKTWPALRQQLQEAAHRWHSGKASPGIRVESNRNPIEIDLSTIIFPKPQQSMPVLQVNLPIWRRIRLAA